MATYGYEAFPKEVTFHIQLDNSAFIRIFLRPDSTTVASSKETSSKVKTWTVTFDKLSENTNYVFTIQYNKDDDGNWGSENIQDLIRGETFTTPQFFSWKLNSYVSNGKTYMYNYNNKPAPITAEQWNRFCNAASDRGITITGARPGDPMLKAVDSAINALGLGNQLGSYNQTTKKYTMKGKIITLDFFETLVNTLNTYK